MELAIIIMKEGFRKFMNKTQLHVQITRIAIIVEFLLINARKGV